MHQDVISSRRRVAQDVTVPVSQSCSAGVVKEIESLADQFVKMKEEAVRVTKREKMPIHLLHKPVVGVLSEAVSLSMQCIKSEALNLVHRIEASERRVSLCVECI